LRPCWAAAIELHAMEPQLGVIEEVECSEGDALVLCRLADMEVTFAVVEQRQGITGAVIFGELRLVRHLDEIAALVEVVVSLAPPALG
jgi:hypothetical protein